jgi:hypothetical protein
VRGAILAAAGLASFAAAALAAPAASQLDRWAGRYSESFMSGSIDGSKYRATNQVEIRPVSARSADVSLSLEFFNGHSCWIKGRAVLEDNQLVLRKSEYQSVEGSPCQLRIWKHATKLRWSDGENTCKAYCGARGTFSRGSVPLRSKRRLPAEPLSGEG